MDALALTLHLGGLKCHELVGKTDEVASILGIHVRCTPHADAVPPSRTVPGTESLVLTVMQ